MAGQSEKLLGVSPADAVGMRPLDFIVDNAEGRRSLELIAVHRAVSRPVTDLLCPLVSRLDGRVRYFLVNAIPVPDGPGAGGFFGVAEDITSASMRPNCGFSRKFSRRPRKASP